MKALLTNVAAAVGKTIESVNDLSHDAKVALHFTDSTVLALQAEEERYEGGTVDFRVITDVRQLNTTDAGCLGILTREEWEVAAAKEREEAEARERAQYERLRRKFAPV